MSLILEGRDRWIDPVWMGVVGEHHLARDWDALTTTKPAENRSTLRSLDCIVGTCIVTRRKQVSTDGKLFRIRSCQRRRV